MILQEDDAEGSFKNYLYTLKQAAVCFVACTVCSSLFQPGLEVCIEVFL